jgi:type I restriction enzyme S subunit
LKQFPIPLPPLDEQRQILDEVDDQISVIDHLEEDLVAKLQSAQGLRQAILCQAFAGKLVPQDPNDEPASELLKRIGCEREARAREATPTPSRKSTNGPHTGRRGRPKKNLTKAN